MRKRSFLRRGTCLNAARAAIETGADADRLAVDHSSIHIRVVNYRCVHIQHRGVVGEVSALPPSAAKADTAVAKAVVHAAVEADMRAPIPGMEEISTTAPAPVARRPQQANRRRLYPDSGNPVVARIAVRPVAGVPEIPIARA